MRDQGDTMAGMHELKQAMVEIVGIAEKFDLGLGVTICNEDSTRYLMRLPSWSLIRAAEDGDIKAAVTLREGERVIGAYTVQPVSDNDASFEAAKNTLHVLSSTADNMREYAHTVEGILDGLIEVLKKHGISVEFKSDDDVKELSYTAFAPTDGELN